MATERGDGWPVGGGEMGERARAFDWSATPLGPVALWPAPLRTAVDLCLNSALPAYVWWGPDLIQVHNDAARAVQGGREALGVPARLAGSGAWEAVGPRIGPVLESGVTVGAQDVPFPVVRGGEGGEAEREEACFTLSCGPVHGPDGLPAGVFVTGIETTARARAEAERNAALETARESADARRASDELARALIANLPGGAVFVVDRDLRYLVAEGEALQAAGIAPADFLGKTLVETTDPALLPRYTDLYRRALGGESFAHEHEVRGRFYVSRGVPLRGAVGDIYAALAVSYDITDRRRVEDALRESEERFRLLVEGARDYAMVLLNPDGRITFWSAGAERIFRWTEGEVIDQPIDLIFTPEDRERGEPAREMGRARAEGRAEDRNWHVRRDGSRFWADGLLMRVDDENGNPRGYAKVTRDATAQKRAEDRSRESAEALRRATEDLARANAELERRVSERTVELTTRTVELAHVSQLRQDLLRELVTAQEEERGRISRDLHDDTGQLLTALLLGLSDLRDSPALAGQPPARAAVSQLLALAGDVARKAHRLAFTLRPTALDDIGLMGALRNYAEEWSRWSGLPVEILSTGMGGADEDRAGRVPPEIETTIYRVTQEALTNIMRHAATGGGPDGETAGASRVGILVQKSASAILTVIEDDGPGFDVEATLNLPPARRRLGLFGMQERARLAGGTLNIESAPGAGTTVYLRLPLA
jgi:PAS domain S-box-containing protein